MYKLCDLHTHSTFSDGTVSPTELVEKAAVLGLTAVALTDHNTLAGLPEFMEAAKEKDISAVPGVEITTGYKGKELHIVGLFVDPADFETVTEYLNVINLRKEESNERLIQTLNEVGYELSYEEIKARHQGNINRAVIAAALKERGYISEISEAFQGLLSEKNGYYVPPEKISSLEVIDFLRSIHAVPVWAHPFLSMKEEEVIGFLQEAKPAGLAVMETRYSTYSPEITERAIQIAKDFDLLESGGSDYHGDNKPDIMLGRGKGRLEVPEQLFKQLQDCHKQLLKL